MNIPTHNIDRYMMDLRQLISLGKKRIGFLIGAGAPASIWVDKTDKKKNVDEGGVQLIPPIAPLTEMVKNKLKEDELIIYEKIKEDLGGDPNIEDILSRARSLGALLGKQKLGEIEGTTFESLAERICNLIGEIVSVSLPKGSGPYQLFTGWIGGTSRNFPIEIFTPNYDLLFEEALEQSRIPYFDGFCGSREPFFDAASVFSSELSNRWVRLWKIHGSLGWDENSEGHVMRTGKASATKLIFPSHLKYDQYKKHPYNTLFDKLRAFLETPDTLLITCGFSFFDSHISSVIEESLAANPSSSVFALQFKKREEENAVVQIAKRRANLSAYCRDGAVINGVDAPWKLGDPPSKEWPTIRNTFWESSAESFLLGNFVHFSSFFALTNSDSERKVESEPSD